MVTSVRIRTCLAVLVAFAPTMLACSSSATSTGSPASGGTGSTAQAVTAASTPAAGTTLAPVAVGTHGRVKAIGEALSQVPLRADQRAELEQLAAEGEARQKAGHAAHGAIMAALADQVAAGKIDRAALQPKIDAATAQVLQSRPLDEAAFNRVHDLLDPQQRNAFADAMEAHGQGHHDHARHHGPMMGEWAADLKLTASQEEQIHAALAAQGVAPHAPAADGTEGPKHDWRAMKEHHHAMLEAFRGEKFAMADFAPPGNMADHADKMGDHFVKLAEAALPILTPEQRTLAAAKLREKAAEPAGDEP